jgi:hypothetical protein
MERIRINNGQQKGKKEDKSIARVEKFVSEVYFMAISTG